MRHLMLLAIIAFAVSSPFRAVTTNLTDDPSDPEHVCAPIGCPPI